MSLSSEPVAVLPYLADKGFVNEPKFSTGAGNIIKVVSA
jgi:hypothetical protein